MNIVTGAAQAVGRTADATTAAAGAIGGAAVNGVIGGAKGVGAGIRSGMSAGSQSSAAAALTLAAVGAAGLIEWPVLLTVGGAALVVHELNKRAPDGRAEQSQSRPASASSKPSAAKRAAKKTPGGRSTARQTRVATRTR